MLLLGRPYTDENGHIDDELFTDLTEEDQAKVMTWIKENIIPIKGVNYKHTSYGLKHYIQKELGIYMTNNQFKDAMLEAGFYPADPNKLNWNYRISEKSPCFKKEPAC